MQCSPSGTRVQTIVSSAVWAAAVGALVGGHVSDRAGRRPTLMLADALFISGSLLMGLVATTAAVLAGRVLVGLGVGVASVTVPVFLAECTEARVRAELVTANVLMITGGQLVSYVANYALTYVPGTWRWMLGAAAAPAALQLAGLQFLPETPQWLLAKVRCSLCVQATATDRTAQCDWSRSPTL